MKTHNLEYKGFEGSCILCSLDNVYFGTIQNIPDIVTYEAELFWELEREFQLAVEDYLKDLEELSRNSSNPIDNLLEVENE